MGHWRRYLDGFKYAFSRAVCSSKVTVVSRWMETTSGCEPEVVALTREVSCYMTQTCSVSVQMQPRVQSWPRTLRLDKLPERDEMCGRELCPYFSAAVRRPSRALSVERREMLYTAISRATGGTAVGRWSKDRW